jgi:two-component system cell cycle response regulator DivK
MTKILVVEDEPLLAELLESLLQMNGHDVIMAPDGEAGVRLALSELPEVILMDLSLPGITGFEAVRLIKQNPAAEAIPVLVLTAHKTSGDKDDAYEAGVAGFVTKPFDHEHLLARIAELAR